MNTFALKYSFYSNPELHLNDNDVKPAWSEMQITAFDDVVKLAKTSSNDIVAILPNGAVSTNDRRVIFFSNIVEPIGDEVDSDGNPVVGYKEKVALLQAKLATHDLAMSPSEPYETDITDSDGNVVAETRISYIVHAMKGSTSTRSTDY